MALNLDPITGLPADFLAPDLYQIPLNSRPQLAPEWSPDHLPPNALHPDNMPSMFATIQAQNSLNPELPQALTTDGAGNLNVNVKQTVGGGGGGSSLVMSTYFNDPGGGAFGGSGSLAIGQNAGLSDPAIKAIVSVHAQFVVRAATASAGTDAQILLYMSSDDHSVQIPLVYLIVGNGTTLFGTGIYDYEFAFSPAVDLVGTFGAGTGVNMRYRTSDCTWSGGYRFRGVV